MLLLRTGFVASTGLVVGIINHQSGWDLAGSVLAGAALGVLTTTLPGSGTWAWGAGIGAAVGSTTAAISEMSSGRGNFGQVVIAGVLGGVAGGLSGAPWQFGGGPLSRSIAFATNGIAFGALGACVSGRCGQ